MMANRSVVHTESEQRIVMKVVKKPAAHVTIKSRIEKMGKSIYSLDVLSEGVSSQWAPRAVWMLHAKASRGLFYMGLHLTGAMTDNRETLEAGYRLYFVDGSGKDDSVDRGIFKFGSNGYYYCGVHIIVDRVVKALRADGSLVVAADVEFFPPPPHDGATVGESDLHTKWRESIGKLESTDSSDCVLMVGGEQLRAHRSILAAISPVFGTMFGNGRFGEARDGIVRIEDPPGMLKDSTAKPYKALISYAYSGCVDWSVYSECKEDVLILACKYLVDDLKRHVEKLLVPDINPETFVGMATLADSYSCGRLKNACVQYLSSHSGAVIFTHQWAELMETRVDLVRELLRLVRESKTTTTAAAAGGTN